MSTVTSLGMNIISRYDRAGMLAARKDMASTGTAASKMGKALKTASLVGAVAITAIGYESVKSSMAFQASMKKIQTQAGSTAGDVSVLSKAVLKLAPSTQQGPEALSESLYHLKSVGMDNVKAMQALKTASDLAALGGANLEDTTNALAGAWRTGIKGAQSFDQTAATVNATIGAGNMRMEDFTAAIGTGILPSAKTFGLSMGQVGAALALFTDEGVPAQAAATRLRMSISLMAAPSMAAEKQLAKIGLTGLKLGEAMRGKDGIIGAIGLLKSHLDASGLSASESAQLLSHAFGGGRSSSAILSMINNFDVLEMKQAQVNKSMGKYGPAVVAQRKTAEAQLNILKSTWQTLMVKIGNSGLLDVTTKSLQGVTLALGGFAGFVNGTAIPAFKSVETAISNMIPVKGIADKLSAAKTLVTDFMHGLGIGDAIAKLNVPAPKKLPSASLPRQKGIIQPGTSSSAAKRLATYAPAQNPRNGIQPPTSRAGGKALTKFTNPNAGMMQSGATVAQAKKLATVKTPSQGKQMADSFTSALKSLDPAKVGAILGKILGVSFKFGIASMGDIGKLILGVLTKIDWVNVGKEAGGHAIGFALGFIGNLGAELFTADFWKKHWLDALLGVLMIIPIGKVFGVLGKLFMKIPILKAIAPFFKSIEKLASPVTKIFDKYIWNPIKDGFTGGFLKIFPSAEGAIGRLFSKIGGWFSSRFSSLGFGVEKMFGQLGSWIGQGIASAIKWLGNISLKFISPFLKAGTWLKSKGIALLTGLKDGILSMAKGIGMWLYNHCIKPQLDMFRSAGTWLWSKGVMMLTGLKNGILSMAKGIGMWLYNHCIKPQVDMFRSAGSWLWSKGRAMITGLKDGTISLAKGIGTWIYDHVIKPQVDRFRTAGSWLWSKGKEIVTGLKNGIVSIARTLAIWIYINVAAPIVNRFLKAKTWLTSHGSELINGLKNGIVSKMKGIANWVNDNIVKPVVNAVKSFFGIHSPSKVFHSMGTMLTAGLIKGMATHSGHSIVNKVFGSMPKALGQLVKKGMIHLEDLPGKAMKALGGLGSGFLSLLGLGGGGGGGNGGSGVQRWKGMVQQVLAMLGQPMSWTDTVLRRMNQESGGNPNAINLWDSNAKAGHPSKGLMQTIPGTFNAYAGPFKGRGIYDPLANIYAGVNYAIHRYGSLSALNRPGGYAAGTEGATKGWHMVGEQGPELRYFRGGEKVKTNVDSMAAISGGSGGDNYFDFRGAVFSGGRKQFEDMVVSAMRGAQDKGRVKKGTVNQ